MGSIDKLLAIARRCSAAVATCDAVQCCGFAGERGFVRPELNEHALRHLKETLPADCAEGVSSSRTCEIGLSEAAGVPYASILYLVERCSSAPASAASGAAPGAGDAMRMASATSSAMSRD
jgi:D-lactate dehydrogenase